MSPRASAMERSSVPNSRGSSLTMREPASQLCVGLHHVVEIDLECKAPQEPCMKTAWEYRKIKLTASNHGTDEILHLNVAGEEGWEIVHISADDVAYLKRPIEKAHPAKRRR